MKTIEFKLGVKTLHLFFNGEAMFRCNELDNGLEEGKPDYISRMLQNDLEGKRVLCKVAGILAEQGELCRRYLQYRPERIPTEEELNLLLTPMACIGLRTAVMQAVNEGFGSLGLDDDGDIDEGLLELEKKTKLSRLPLI